MKKIKTIIGMTLFLTVVAANVQYGINKYNSDSEWFSKIIADGTGTGTGTTTGSGSGAQCPTVYVVLNKALGITAITESIECKVEGRLDIQLTYTVRHIYGNFVEGLNYPVNRYFEDCVRDGG